MPSAQSYGATLAPEGGIALSGGEFSIPKENPEHNGIHKIPYRSITPARAFNEDVAMQAIAFSLYRQALVDAGHVLEPGAIGSGEWTSREEWNRAKRNAVMNGSFPRSTWTKTDKSLPPDTRSSRRSNKRIWIGRSRSVGGWAGPSFEAIDASSCPWEIDDGRGLVLDAGDPFPLDDLPVFAPH